MRKLILVLIGGFGSVAAFAQDLLECVNPDVLNGLVLDGAYDDPAAFSSSSHPLMSDVSTPGQFNLIGTAERDLLGSSMVSVIFRSSVAPSEAIDAAMNGLAESGWEARQQQSGLGSGVFASASVAQPNLACLDDQPVTVSAGSIDGTTYVNYSFAMNQANSCTSPATGGAMFIRSSISQGMPSLEFPPDPETGEPVRSQGGSSGGSQAVQYSATQIAHGASLNSLVDHLSQQLTEQGWEADASWNGATTAGSSWSRLDESGTPVQGMLQLTALNHSRYDVLFRIVSRQ